MCMMLSSAEDLTLLEAPTFRFIGLQSLCFNEIWFFWSVLWISPSERSADVSEPCPPRDSWGSLLQLSAFPLLQRGTGVRPGECLGQKSIELELREAFQVSPPSWHSSGLKEAPGQKWPKTGTNSRHVARRKHPLPRPTLLCPHIASWFWLEGWRIITRQRCCLHGAAHQDGLHLRCPSLVSLEHFVALKSLIWYIQSNWFRL